MAKAHNGVSAQSRRKMHKVKLYDKSNSLRMALR